KPLDPGRSAARARQLGRPPRRYDRPGRRDQHDDRRWPRAGDPHQRRPALRRGQGRVRHMTEDSRPGAVIVIADDGTRAARVEAALRLLKGWRIDVGRPGQLQGLLTEHPEAIVALVLDAAAGRRMLRTMRAWPRSPAIVAVSDNPAQLWTSAARALGL